MKYITHNSFKPLLPLLVLLVAFVILDIDFLSTITMYIVIVLLFIYRKPKRRHVDSSGVITSLVDGVVIGIDRLEDKIRIRIEKSIFSPSALISPIKSNIIKLEKRNGLYLPISSLLSKNLNEKYNISFDCGKQIDVEIIPSTLALGGVNMYVNNKDDIGFGQEIGFLMQGEINIYLSNDAILKINIGDKLKSAQSIIASI